MKFIYNGRIYNPSDVEKKLKKLGITINDVEIIPDEKKFSSVEDDYMKDKIKVIVRSNIDDIRRVCYIKKDEPHPTIKKLFENQLWNPNTKTGIKELTENYLMTLYYEN